MKVEVHQNDERGYFNQKWIKSYFSFSYADYHNSRRPGFGKLLVLNEDHIQAQEGFPARPHKDMEIISIPLEGELHHTDSLGNDVILKKGSVQSISAGSGISHSEVNSHNEKELQVLHIWIESQHHNGEPIYQSKNYFKKDRINKWQLLASGDKNDGGNYIHQDAYIYRIFLTNTEPVEYKKRKSSHGIYLFVIDGKVKIGDQILNKKDAIAIPHHDTEIKVQSKGGECDILVIEVPMQLKSEA